MRTTSDNNGILLVELASFSTPVKPIKPQPVDGVPEEKTTSPLWDMEAGQYKPTAQDSPASSTDSQPSTANCTSDGAGGLDEGLEAERAEVVSSSNIASRIVKNHALRYMAELPGCDLYWMPELPDDLVTYKTSYILVDYKELFYIKDDGKKESVTINDFNVFQQNLQTLNLEQMQDKLHLTDKQLNQFIVSNGGHLGNRHQYKFTTIVTKDGLYQLNREFHEFRCVLTLDVLQTIAPVLISTLDIGERDGSLAYDDLTLEQLNRLEQTIRDHGGYTIIGYSINEEVFLQMIGLGCYEYPPMPYAFPKRVLDTINMDMVRDTTVSLRSAALALILFQNVVFAYMQYDSTQSAAYQNFYYNNVLLFLLVTASVAISELFILRSGIYPKEKVLTGINRFRLIEESMIGMSANWSTYGSLMLSPTVVGYGVIPVLLYGFRKGWVNEDSLHTTSVINIANKTGLKTFWNALSYALPVGSFFALGSEYFLLDIVFSSNADDAYLYNKFYVDRSYVQYTACALALLSHLARHPQAPSSIQKFGRYASNVSNTMGNVMLDNFAMCSILSMVLELIFVNGISSEQQGLLMLLYGLQTATLLYSFCMTFATTPDLPEFSIKPNPTEKTILAMYYEKIEQIKQTPQSINHLVTNASMELTSLRAGNVVAQIGHRFRLFSTENPLSQNQEKNSITPLHATIISV